MKACHGYVADIRKIPTQSVCKATIEFPIEAYVQLVAMLDSQKVLITISTLDMPYGIVDSGQQAIKEGETTTDEGRGEKTPVGLINKPQLRGYCGLAIDLCKRPDFWAFMAGRGWLVCDEKTAKEAVCMACEVASRKDIDLSEEASILFERNIRQPWMVSTFNPHRGLVE